MDGAVGVGDVGVVVVGVGVGVADVGVDVGGLDVGPVLPGWVEGCAVGVDVVGAEVVGVGDDFLVLPPNRLVPLPDWSWMTLVRGRPAASSMLVTMPATIRNRPAAATAAFRHVNGRRARTGSAAVARVPVAGAIRAGGRRNASGRIGTTFNTRSRVRRMEWLYRALPTTVTTLASAAPITVPLTPK